MTDEERGLGLRWFEEVWNDGRREAIAELLSADAVVHEGEKQAVGPEGFYAFYDRLNATFSEMHVHVQDTIAEGDRSCMRWTATCKHTGDGLGMPPTQKIVSVTGITILRVANGRIVEGWQNWDMLGLLEQIQESGRSATYIAAS